MLIDICLTILSYDGLYTIFWLATLAYAWQIGPFWQDTLDVFCYWLYTYSILGYVYGFVGRPVKLECGDAISDGREDVKWSSGYFGQPVATGVYVDGVLINATYYNRLADGRAELSVGGSLIIHSYEGIDAGGYQCDSEYRYAWSDLTTASLYILWIVCVGIVVVSLLSKCASCNTRAEHISQVVGAFCHIVTNHVFAVNISKHISKHM